MPPRPAPGAGRDAVRHVAILCRRARRLAAARWHRRSAPSAARSRLPNLTLGDSHCADLMAGIGDIPIGTHNVASLSQKGSSRAKAGYGPVVRRSPVPVPCEPAAAASPSRHHPGHRPRRESCPRNLPHRGSARCRVASCSAADQPKGPAHGHQQPSELASHRHYTTITRRRSSGTQGGTGASGHGEPPRRPRSRLAHRPTVSFMAGARRSSPALPWGTILGMAGGNHG